MAVDPTKYVYDSTQMEAIFEELTSEDGEYCYRASWSTVNVKNQETGKFEPVENMTHDIFFIDSISFEWYHGRNMKTPEHPVLLASWTTGGYHLYDGVEHELEIVASADEVARVASAVKSGDSAALYWNGPDTLQEARGEW
jgi:hypothetical protein